MRLVLLLFFSAAFAAEVKQQHVKMPGDDGFGFFHAPGYCRIRMRIRCNFALATTKSPYLIAEIRIKDNFLRSRTDDDGVFDVKFKCSNELYGETVKFNTAKYSTSFKLSDAPEKIKIPEHRCNTELQF